MTTQTFANKSTTDLSFTNISITEVDTGDVSTLIGQGNAPTVQSQVIGSYQALDLSAFSAGAYSPSSSISVTLSYDVTSKTAGSGITALQQGFTPDGSSGSVHLMVSEKVYDANNNLVGSTYTDLSRVTDPTNQGYAFGDILLNQGYASLHVVITLTASVDAGASSSAYVFLSDFEQGFQVAPISTAPQPGTITGRVFLDQNADGTQGTGDTNLAGVTVQLLDSAGHVIVGVTAVTDANGAYSFTGLASGNYAVAFTAPTGDKFSPAGSTSIVNAAGQTAQFAVAAGGTTANINAGVYAPASITAHVYSDTNKDGTQGTGETGAAGVTVKLLTGAGVDTGTTAVTDSNGNVTFTGLVPGSYQIAVVAPTGQTATQVTNVGTPITLTSGQTASATEGLFGGGALSGRVFLDQNADGVFLSGDTTLSGITVQLLDSSGNAIAGKTTVTDSNGNYSFTGLIPGNYAVAITAPAGNQFSQVGTNANAALDSIVNSAGKTSPVAVTTGNTTANQNAGVYVPASIAAHVYSDTNKDGTQGTGETGAAGVTVKLLTGAGVDTGRTAVTDSNGNVTFSGLVPGSYQIAVVAPTGQTATQVTNVGTPITLTSGQTATATEGLFGGGALSGRVFLDQNADGVFLSGDTTLSGITVQLLDSSGNAIAGKTTVTDSNGNYSFTGLIPGNYAVAITAPAGNQFSQVGTNANAALDSIVNSAGKTSPVAVTTGNTTANQNAGVYVPASITAHVYADTNKDGTQGTGEAAAAGITVKLLTGAGADTGRTAVTDANGNVTFSGLVPGSYQIAVVAPTGQTATQVTNVGTPITLTSGQTASATEGLFNPGSISGRVFGDFNADGVFNTTSGNDFGLSGQTVQLLNASGQPIAGVTTVTDANGNYSFTNLVPGTYQVQVVGVAGAKFSQVGTNANASLDSVVNASGVSPTFTVSAGATTQNINAGEYTPGTITTHVYTDTNKDGTQGAGESARAGVTVNLLTGTGAATGQSAVTDANGNVSFTGLAPGSYQVAVAAPTGTTAKQVVNVGTPLTLAVGQTINAIEGLVSTAPSLTIHKTASVSSTTPGTVCPPLTYTFTVTNTGTTALTGVKIVDVINGDPSTAQTFTYSGSLAAGATWTYTTAAQTVSATKGTLPTIGSGHGFDLGDVATYGVIAFNPGKFVENSQGALIGNVGIGSYGSVSVGGGGIAGNVVTTGAVPSYSCSTAWSWSSLCYVTTTTGVQVTGNANGLSTSYGTAGWGQNWADEAGGSNNCYSSYGCNGSTGSTVWDNFWNQSCSQTTSALVLKVSEDAYCGDAQFTVCVDGKQVGGVYTATMKHGSGSQSINLGNYATGSNHTVSVNFLNDRYDSGGDRNLYVDGLTFGSVNTAGAALLSQGVQTFSVGAAAKQTLTVKLSEDYYGGHAQFTICVDGNQVGGTYTATTSHGKGSQSINLGDYDSTVGHKVVVTFLNDYADCNGDRNLYVDGVTFGSTSIGGASLCTNGSKTFSVGSTGTSSCDYTTPSCNDYNDDTWGNFFNASCSTAVLSSSYAGKAYNTVGNSTSLSADITALKSLSSTLFAETGTSVNLSNGCVLNATTGTLDAGGNEVFTVKSWSQGFTVSGDGSHSVVLNIASGVTPVLGDLKLTGGLTANQVLINYTGSGTITDANCTTFNGTILAPNAKFSLDSGTINGHVLGGGAGQDFTIGYNATIDAPPLQSYTLTDVATVTGSYNGVTASSFDTASVTVNPVGAGVTYDCNKPGLTDNLWSKFGQVGKLEFCFKQDSGVSTRDSGCGISTGSCNVGTNPCFIVVNDKADCFSSSTNYFKGNVCDGDKLFCDANSLWDGKAGSGCFSGNTLYAHVFACQDDYLAGKPTIQENCLDVSGAHGISLGDKVGCLSVAGYVSTSGNGYLCS